MDDFTQRRIQTLSHLHAQAIEKRDLVAAEKYQIQFEELMDEEDVPQTSCHEYVTTFATLGNPILGLGVFLWGKGICNAVDEFIEEQPVIKSFIPFL